ncbi:hypothetical protein BpHYR1_037969 [Brachionus plicatilis]|uniref:Uncharacterized protein n=1 Tax=Brachionus plicatilis TaxID=10195 RepID=A0A3M7QMD7_BRAPC|nr:hypothetical protein BpHYR1_037969 [Brachionus plicatilis]
MHVAQRRLTLGHFNGRNSQGPQVATVIIGGIRILVTCNHLRRHPIRKKNKFITPINVFLLPMLSRDAKVDQFDIGIVSEKNILALDVSVNDFVGVQVRQTAQNVPTNVSDPFFFEKIVFRRLDQIGH